MIYKSHACKAGRRRARMERLVDPDPLSGPGPEVVDPLSGPGAGHWQAVQPPAASEVDLKFLAGGPGSVVVVVGGAGSVVVVVGGPGFVVVVVVGGAASVVVVVGGTASVVVVSTPVGALPVVVVSPPVVVASGVVPADVVVSDVVASGVVPQQTMISSAEQVGRVVAANLDVVAAALMVEATQVATKRTTATFIFSSAFSLSFSHWGFVCRDCGSYLCSPFYWELLIREEDGESHGQGRVASFTLSAL